MNKPPVIFHSVSPSGPIERFAIALQDAPPYCQTIRKLPKMQESILRALGQLSDILLMLSDRGAVLACLQDGCKVLLLRRKDGRVSVCFLRSGVTDHHFIEWLSYWVEVKPAQLTKQFKTMPKLPDALERIRAKVGDELASVAHDDTEFFCAYYNQKGQQRTPYQFDAHLFRNLLCLREMLCHLKVQLLVVGREEIPGYSGKKLARFYNYQTTDALPGRPPICAVRATEQMLELVANKPSIVGRTPLRNVTRGIAGRVEWAEPGQDDLRKDRKSLSLISSVCGNKFALISGPVYAFRIEGLACDAVLEIGAQQVDPEEVLHAETVIGAALDPSGFLAVQSLKALTSLDTPRKGERLHRLVSHYKRVLDEPKGFAPPMSKKLIAALAHILDYSEEHYSCLLHPVHAKEVKKRVLAMDGFLGSAGPVKLSRQAA